jgi:hypothetical protein
MLAKTLRPPNLVQIRPILAPATISA